MDEEVLIFLESENGTAITMRYMYPYGFFRSVMENFMEQGFQSPKLIEKWKNEGRIVTPFAEEKLREMEHKAGFLNFKPSNNYIAFVQDSHIGPKQTLYRRVNIE